MPIVTVLLAASSVVFHPNLPAASSSLQGATATHIPPLTHITHLQPTCCWPPDPRNYVTISGEQPAANIGTPFTIYTVPANKYLVLDRNSAELYWLRQNNVDITNRPMGDDDGTLSTGLIFFPGTRVGMRFEVPQSFPNGTYNFAGYLLDPSFECCGHPSSQDYVLIHVNANVTPGTPYGVPVCFYQVPAMKRLVITDVLSLQYFDSPSQSWIDASAAFFENTTLKWTFAKWPDRGLSFAPGTCVQLAISGSGAATNVSFNATGYLVEP